MPRLAFLFAPALFLLSSTALAADEDHVDPDPDDDVPTFGLLVDPGGVIGGAAQGIAVIRPQFQFGFDEYIGLDLIPGYAYLYNDWAFEGAEGHAIGMQAGLRFSLQGRGLRGAYFAPRVGVVHARASAADVSLEATHLYPSFEFGYGWAWGSKDSAFFMMQAGFGLGYHARLSGYDVFEQDPMKGVSINGNFSIGIGF